MNGRQWRMFQSMVKAAQGVTHTHRYRIIGDAIGSGTTEYKPIIKAIDDPNYDTDPNATTPAECEVGSRIVGVDLLLNLAPATAGTDVEYILFKDPDAIFSGSTVVPADLFTNDVSSTTLLVRKYTLSYGYFRSTASKESRIQKIRIGRAALGRAGTLSDNDQIILAVRTGSANTTLDYIGRIWTRK